ncbi:MAG: ankyrin repeat domain-containing protein [Verrucomicrobiales bacterium]|nr:ankyrin repeat domain-containing protein [Verrucomicrobiales bacterium]
MFFLIGLFLGALGGAVAQFLIGTPLLIGKGLGLLWGDRRIWWTLALVLAVIIGWYWTDASNRHRDTTDQLQKGFLLYRNIGVAIGAGLVWLIGLLILFKFGSGWRDPISGFAPALSVITICLLGFLSLNYLRKPEKVRDKRSANQLAWAQAMKEANLPEVKKLIANGHKFWSNSPELPGGPVLYATDHQDVAFLLELIELHPVPANARLSALRRSAANDSREKLAGILNTDFASRDPMIAAAISVAISEGNRELYDWLFSEYPIDPGTPPTTGPHLLMDAARTGQIEFARDLLEKGADIEQTRPGSRHVAENALGNAIHWGQPAMLKFLLDQGADPNARSEGAYTALMRAVEQRKPDMVPVLLEAGADPNLADEKGFTALHIATRGNRPNFEIAKVLLDAGADPNKENIHGFRPITKLPAALGGEGE